MTSLTGEYVRIYPMPVWLEIEEKLAQVPSTHPARLKFFDRVNYYGQTAEFDIQGRVLIHPRLRESASMTGEVDVFGQYNYLDVWNHERFVVEAPARALHRRRRAGARRNSESDGDDQHARPTRPCMVAEAISLLEPGRGGLFVDCTVGLGGHARALLEAGATRLIGLDRDREALAHGGADAGGVRRSRASSCTRTIASSAACSGRARRRRVDGVLADLGVSSMQLDARGPRLQLPARRAARHAHGPERRRRPPPTCSRDVGEEDLANVIFQYGEERFSRRIARAIVATRAAPIPSPPPASWRRWCGAPCRARATSGSIPPRARSRRCASG